MLSKIHALPTPPSTDKFLHAGASLDDLLTKHHEMSFDLAALHKSIEKLAAVHCGTGQAQDVELYDGTLGVSREFVNACQRPVGQLQWLRDLPQRFNGPHDSPGTVNGIRWATGALISSSLFLTAGHALASHGGSWVRPKRNDTTIEPFEIATLMQVNFDYQIDGQTNEPHAEHSFPVKKLLEHGLPSVDYAIVELGPDANGLLPGDLFGTLTIAAADLKTPGSLLCIIQHPHQGVKIVETGKLLENNGGLLFYNDVDVGNGSSGSPVLSKQREIVGIHISGGCMTIGGADRGQAIGAIRNVSSLI